MTDMAAHCLRKVKVKMEETLAILEPIQARSPDPELAAIIHKLKSRVLEPMTVTLEEMEAGEE